MAKAGILDYEHSYTKAAVSEANPLGGSDSRVLVRAEKSQLGTIQLAFPEYRWRPAGG